MPWSSPAICWTTCSQRATNAVFSSRSAGGYPQTESSGNTTRSAPGSSLAGEVQDFYLIAREIPDRRIDLGERELHSFSLRGADAAEGRCTRSLQLPHSLTLAKPSS